MSAATLPSTPQPPAPAQSAGRVVAIVIGTVLAFLAFIALALGGAALWAHTTQRDADGWFNSSWHRLDTSTRALTAEGVDLGDIRGGPEDWIPDLGPVRLLPLYGAVGGGGGGSVGVPDPRAARGPTWAV